MLNNLKPTEGSRTEKTRRCRGLGSGLGKNGGSGNKGQNSRSGGGVRLGFEGGQLPLFRRLPKRGFKNFGRTEYAVINLGQLNVFNDGDEVNLTVLIEKGLIKKEFDGLKVLGNGELTKKITITANKFSASALENINKVGAKAVVLE
ncbi:MAG: 50S ribosomal protein L15 [Candidatus Onthovivens sp.]|nr:50S ribosomal protein L15 [Candidatus Onthovivens sp.]